MRTLEVVIGDEVRLYRAEDFPLSLGGPRPHLPLPPPGDREPAAHLGCDGGDLFIQPAQSGGGQPSLACNGVPLTASRWLEAGDRLAVGDLVFTVAGAGDALQLVAETEPATDGRSEGSADPVGFEAAPPMAPVAPAAFTPGWQRAPPPHGLRVRPRTVLMAFVVAVLAAAAWYVLTARTVAVETDPPAESLRISGGFAPGFGGRYLLRPGRYRVEAGRTGYLLLIAELELSRATPDTVRFALEPLGATLSVRSRPAAGAEVTIDGRPAGTTPLDGFQLAAGEHAVGVAAPLHLPFSTTVVVEPGSPPLRIDADLTPNWAPLALASSPAGATVLIDGRPAGTTPVSTRVEAGSRTVELRLDGFKEWRRPVAAEAGAAVDLGTVTLQPLDGRLAVDSSPRGAAVMIGSSFRGTTPLEVAVPPGAPLEVRVSLAGHRTSVHEVTVASGSLETVGADLEMLTGEVVITSEPPGAALVVDGAARGTTGQTLVLPARPHAVEVRLDGYEPYRTDITPEPGLTRAVRALLVRSGPDGLPATISSPQNVELVMVRPGRFAMGAARREPGRRANEIPREVEITRPYYLAVREVSNREFREFSAGHRSGAFAGHNLEIDHHPVVNVSWEDAARYTNWLSEKAGLPPVYAERGGTLVPRTPLPAGYRLPTEAEWAWAARYAGSAAAAKYPWGDALPIPGGAGNFGDASAEAALRAALPGYNDGWPATAPVGSFTANALGIFNLGDNVAEWVQDVYAFAPGAAGVVEKDPSGPASGSQHVIRGASWMDTAVTELRLSYRDSGEQPRPDLGFRIARSAQ